MSREDKTIVHQIEWLVKTTAECWSRVITKEFYVITQELLGKVDLTTLNVNHELLDMGKIVVEYIFKFQYEKKTQRPLDLG